VPLSLALAYLAMPFDLIPDFLPFIGQLDDLVIIPAVVLLALRFIPKSLLLEHRIAFSRNSDVK
jgi:carbonic anhydrase